MSRVFDNPKRGVSPKFFLWPLVLWLAATRRYVTAALACVAGTGFLVLSWAAIGFAGLGDYGSIVRRVQGTVESDSYTAFAMFQTPGSGPPIPLETSATLAVAALTIALALRSSVEGVRPAAPGPEPAPSRAAAHAA